jgi:hypothetical protein
MHEGDIQACAFFFLNFHCERFCLDRDEGPGIGTLQHHCDVTCYSELTPPMALIINSRACGEKAAADGGYAAAAQ